MKLPSSVGQKKIKALEQMLLELGVGECGGWAPQDGPSHQKGPPPSPTSPPKARLWMKARR